MLFVMGARPNLVDFADNMVIEKHRTVILNRFDIDIKDISEIQLDDFGTDGAQIAACDGVETHSDLNKRMNGKLLLNHILGTDGTIGLDKCFLLGILCTMLQKISLISDTFKQMIKDNDILSEPVDK